uniref:Secreted protein n=1 Tax=Brugia timori TaxID=42155 RepID=A0A0R3Q527_9BILA
LLRVCLGKAAFCIAVPCVLNTAADGIVCASKEGAVTATGFRAVPVADLVNFGLLFCECGNNADGDVSLIAKFLITACADAL